MKSLMTKIIALAAVAMLGISFTANAGSAKNGYNKQKVVYHINDINKANGALRNVKNHLNALGDENAEIIVVTHSSGAFALVDGSTDAKGHHFESTVQALSNRGVQFRICANTIRGKKIPKDKINLNAKVVPSGVAEVADLEQKGYLYIKP
jgi:intracellular sulfur oxidation DsrE/DsrF family protein